MTTERGSIHMPIATVIMSIIVLVYIFLLAVGRAGKWLRTFGVRGGQGTSVHIRERLSPYREHAEG